MNKKKKNVDPNLLRLKLKVELIIFIIIFIIFILKNPI